MGKKRGKDKSSREEEEPDVIGSLSYYHQLSGHMAMHRMMIFMVYALISGPSCRHIKKGTDQTFLKKLSGNSKWTSCQDCKDEENKENVDNFMQQDCEEEQETPAIWMCLKCGHSVSFPKCFF